MITAPLRVLVVDDEPLAREHLRALAAAEHDLEIVGEAASGTEAVRLIRQLSPDLVFLDVHMPGLDGFGVLRALSPDEMPLVVFVTAYDAHAVNAFEVSAVDYLLKPVVDDRFHLAARRAVERAKTPRTADVLGRLSEALARLETTPAHDRIPVPVDGRVIFVSQRDIDWVDAADDLVKIHAGRAVHVLRDTMANIESRLRTGFLRIHRSTIVNVERIREVQPWVKGDYVVILNDGTRLTTGRTYRERVRALLK